MVIALSALALRTLWSQANAANEQSLNVRMSERLAFGMRI